MSRPIRVIISGGGTGGHIYPAIAIAKAIVELLPGSQLLFVGALGKMEMEKVPQAGFPIVGLWISGLQRGKILPNLLLPAKVISSLVRSLGLIRRFRPDLVIGTGGYASWAVVFAAALTGKKILLQEQNSYAGLTNRFLSRWADVVCVAYPGLEARFKPARVVFTGNPIRPDIGKGLTNRAEAFRYFGLSAERQTLLVLGGSLGARTINQAMTIAAPLILQQGYQIIWQTGKFYFDLLVNTIEPHPNLKIMPFISEMPFAYEVADLVVSRAGALSISEIAAVELPAILIPSPNVAEDHQTQNARTLSESGAAILIPDNEAEAKLAKAVLDLLGNQPARQKLSANISLFAKRGAAKEIAELSARLILDEM